MKQLRAWMIRLYGMLFRQRREQEMAEEMESHLQLHIEDNLRAGSLTNPAIRCAGLAVNTSRLAVPQRERYLSELEKRLGVPAFDPVATGPGRLVEHLKSFK